MHPFVRTALNFVIFNSTPVIALSRFIGVVEGLLTPIDKKWHSLKPKDPTLTDNKDVQDWFYTVNELLFKYRYNPSIGVKSPSTTPMNLLSAITGVELNILYPFAAPVFILTS
jgi:hypothetical protein